MSDGITSEGVMFRPRWQALREAFDLYGRVPNKDLMRETLNLIDATFPADATLEEPKSPRLLNSGSVMLLAFF